MRLSIGTDLSGYDRNYSLMNLINLRIEEKHIISTKYEGDSISNEKNTSKLVYWILTTCGLFFPYNHPQYLCTCDFYLIPLAQHSFASLTSLLLANLILCNLSLIDPRGRYQTGQGLIFQLIMGRFSSIRAGVVVL